MASFSGPLIIIDNYDSFTYNLFQMVQAVSPHPVEVFRNDAVDFEALCALQPVGVILSPGPGHPANPSDFGVCQAVVTRQPQLNAAVLGVCLGHQGMAHHWGGQVVPAPAIFHGKTSAITITATSPLFEGIVSPLTVMRYHSWVVKAETLPDCFEVTATEPDSGTVMAMQHRAQPLYGVQFHPESIGTPEGGRLLANFVALCLSHTAKATPKAIVLP